MSGKEQYRSRYPRGGTVALLCEGDVAGYEVDLIRAWLDERLGTKPLVDVWPCGTASSILGFSDAIGRARPIVVVEDRDFRSPDETKSDCRRNLEDRANREIQVLAWRTWLRNEIENYLIEPAVVLPSFAEAFQCSQDEVGTALTTMLPALAAFQAVQWALYKTRREWYRTAPDSFVRTSLRTAIYPQWSEDGTALVPPDFAQARKQLEINLSNWRSKAVGNSRAFAADFSSTLLSELDGKFSEWREMSLASSTWRTEWSGKEVLQWLRLTLTARKGWYNGELRKWQKLEWTKMKRAERDGLDRALETAMKRTICTSFLQHLKSGQAGDTLAEWDGIAEACRTAPAHPQQASVS